MSLLVLLVRRSSDVQNIRVYSVSPWLAWVSDLAEADSSTTVLLGGDHQLAPVERPEHMFAGQPIRPATI